MTESDSKIAQQNDGELVYYTELEKYINSLSTKFQEKSVIKQSVYDDIIKCLLSSKDKPLGLFSSKFVFWIKKLFIVIKIFGSTKCHSKRGGCTNMGQ
ncbi:unnamed protein product [Rotaria sp. Silwood1]|nr:unnamed protein product [Rotaria sp. Silwood1]